MNKVYTKDEIISMIDSAPDRDYVGEHIKAIFETNEN